MKEYSFQILRYLPDQVSGEFVNVGIVLFSKEEKFLKSQVITRIGRVKHLFPEVESRVFTRRLKQLSGRVNSLGRKWSNNSLDLYPYDNIESATVSVLPKDDSALIFSTPQVGIDLDFESVLDDLYDRLVEQHNVYDNRKYLTDKEVWRTHYKTYFEKHEFNKKLKSRAIKTKENSIEFDFAVKNGQWNYLEPVTFDLTQVSNIKDKVYKWMGKLDELDSSDEKFNLYLLSIMPDDADLRKFINDRIVGKSVDNFEVKIIEPKDAESFVEDLEAALDHS